MPSRRFVPLAAAIGTLTALALTWPLPLTLRTAVLEDGSYDAYQFMWNIWWVCESLVRLHTSPFFTHLLFYPTGVGLLFHTLSASIGLLSIPLQLTLPGGVVTAHNVLVIAAPGLTVVATALLAREVTGDPWAALIGALVAAIDPIGVWFLPVLYLDCVWLVALLVWTWWRMHRRRRALDLVLALALTAALIFASQEYAMMTLALLALDTLARTVAPGAFRMPPAWRAGTLAFWLVAGAGLGALARVAGATPATPPPAFHVMLGSGYVAGLVVPPWLVPPPGKFWSLLYLGTVPLLLVPVALLGRRGPVAFWGIATLALVVMSLGPYLHILHPLPDMQLPPGGLQPSGPRGPYWLAMQIVPILRFFRTPYRWVMVAQLGLAMLVALAATSLRARATGARRACTLALFVAVVGGGAFDVQGLRAPLASAAVPQVYDVVRDDPARGAILELPSGIRFHTFALLTSRYMYFQTRHRKPLLEGTVSRLPPDARVIFQRRFTDFAEMPWIEYVAIHRDLLPESYPVAQQQVAAIETVLASQADLVARDQDVDLYRLRTFRPDTVTP